MNGADKNTITSVQYRYREKAGTWGSWTNLTTTLTTGKFTCNNVILSLDNSKSFEFEIQVTDKLQTNTKNAILDVGQAIFFISSNKKQCYINGINVMVNSTYSTDEEIIGTWTNGKPIYRKIINTFTPSSASTSSSEVATLPDNQETLVKLEAQVYQPNLNVIVPIPFCFNTNNMGNICFNPVTKKICANVTNEVYTNAELRVIAYYTKKID